MSMKEMLDKANSVKPITEKDGAKVVSYEDAVLLAQAEVVEGYDFGDRELNPDGSIAKSRVTVLAVNPEKRTANRYRVVEKASDGDEPKKLLQVVNDYRAVEEQKTGRVYRAQLLCHELERVKGKLKVVRTFSLPREEFISEFTGTLSVEAMYEVNEAIARNENNQGIDEMPI